ncbi:MAG: ferric reductase-like transmembrane domain-containing protein, partial [Desulfovibrionales bacterium]
MRSISRTLPRTLPVTCSVAFTLTLWLGSKWYFQDWFADPFKYPAKAASLSVTVLMCWCILLSTRWRFLEEWFHGLDKVYQVHKRLGRLAFFIILLHPICLGLDQLPHLIDVLGDMWFVVPEGDTYLWGQNLGVAALLVMSLLVALTLWIKPPYHLWKRSHEWFGLVLGMVVAHILLVDADIAAYPLLRLWMYGLLLLALGAFTYIRFLYRYLGPHFRYRVSRIEKTEDILELTFTPVEEKMDFKPSQFVYLSVERPDISPEPHPYSIACGYNLAARFKLGIKQVGDHTRSLDRLTTGDPVTVYGPYGRFSEPFLSGERDCLFIGGGIGITPMISMAASLAAAGTPVELHYAGRSRGVMAYADRLGETLGAALSLHCDDEGDTALNLDALLGALGERHLYICGPRGLIDAARAGAEAAGIPAGRVHVELFDNVSSGASAPAAQGDQPFEVEVASTGEVFTIPPGRSIIEVLEEGVQVKQPLVGV